LGARGLHGEDGDDANNEKEVLGVHVCLVKF